MGLGLTSRQRDALRFISACRHEPPTYRQLSRALNLKAVSAAFKLVEKLAERGHLLRRPGGFATAPDAIIDGEPFYFIRKTRSRSALPLRAAEPADMELAPVSAGRLQERG